MFSKPTVLILGAGASHECGLPLGDKLKSIVAAATGFYFEHGNRLTKGDARLFQMLFNRYTAAGELKKFTDAGTDLAAASPHFPSIDELLHYFSHRPELISLGKIAIVKAVLEAETSSMLRIDPSTGLPNLTLLDQTWYPQFFSMAISGLRQENIATIFSNLTVINFNYDRTFEYFLFQALTVRSGISPTSAAAILKELRVIRPYGSVGRLTWENPSAIGLGTGGGDAGLWAATNGIRTFTEAHETTTQVKIDQSLNRSDLILMLGFGFHPQNMTLLKPGNLALRTRPARTVFATTYGINTSNHSILRKDLQSNFHTQNIELPTLKCAELVKELRPSIITHAN